MKQNGLSHILVINIRAIILALFLLIPFSGVAQVDTNLIAGTKVKPLYLKEAKSPHKASLFSAVLPGMGQIYNQSYWKAPVVWIGLGISGYFLYTNQKGYIKYKNAYRDYVIEDPANTSYEQIIYDSGLNYEDLIPGGKYSAWFENSLNNQKQYYRKYRDYSYVAIGLVYVLNIVDAAVDAHFSQFDISDDLTLKWQPYATPNVRYGMDCGIGINLVFK